ncbi:MAG: glycosyltransferase family A protein [bacterium]
MDQKPSEATDGMATGETTPPALLFSICVPAVKARHLGEALRSLVKQTWRDFEIIVLDDAGAPDVQQTVSAIQDPRIIYRRYDLNMGADYPSRTWNSALEFVRGEFVVLLGDDDCLAENYLEAMRKAILSMPGADLYRARLRIIGPYGATLLPETPIPETETWDEFLYRRATEFFPQSTAEMCVRTAALRKLGGYAILPMALGSDDITWLRMSVRAPVVSTNETYACWRIHPGGLSHQGGAREMRLEACANAHRIQLALLSEHEPSRIPREKLIQAVTRFWDEHRRSIERNPVLEVQFKLRLWWFFSLILTAGGQQHFYRWHMRRKLKAGKSQAI